MKTAQSTAAQQNKTAQGKSPQGDEGLALQEQLDAAGVLVRLSFMVQAAYGEIAATHSLTPAQAKLLCILKDAPRGMTELTQLLQLEKSSVSGLVDRTHQRELIERETSAVDRRAVTIRLSPAGREVAEAFYLEASVRLAQLVEHLPARERSRFVRLTGQIIEGANAG